MIRLFVYSAFLLGALTYFFGVTYPLKLNAENLTLFLSSVDPDEKENDAANTEELDDMDQLEQAEVTHHASQGEMQHTGVYWAPPKFSAQESATGWSQDAFAVPPGMKERVAFWVDVYTKWSTTQAVLHDSKYLDIIYRTEDLSDIERDSSMNNFEKYKAKEKRVKKIKEEIKAQLKRIHDLQDTPGRLSPEDLKVFNMFRFIDDKKRFLDASQKSRLRMQLGQSDRFKLGIYYSGRFIREMEAIFKEEGMPIELTRLPFVESSFNIYAYSKVGASGIWQFMPRTGRLFKLKMDSVRDLRNDPLTATRAAARMLGMNYKMLGSWPLALTAYNHGPAGVARESKRLKTNDLNKMIWNSTGRRFGFASENFYAEFLAAVHVESNAEKYFGRIEVSPPLLYDEIELQKPTRFFELAWAMLPDKTEEGADVARFYNPYFSRLVRANAIAIPAGFKVRVPKGLAPKVVELLSQGAPQQARYPSAKAGAYRVLPGDTLTSLSRDFGVSIKQLAQANGIGIRSLLRPGQKIIIPGWDKE